MKILVADAISKDGVEILEKEDGLKVDVKTGLSVNELIGCIPDYNGLIVRSATKVTKEVIEAGKNLKVIGRAGVGIDNVDVEEAKAGNAIGVKVTERVRREDIIYKVTD